MHLHFPALYHAVVIFSSVKSTGNSRHSFAVFPVNRNSLKGCFKNTLNEDYNLKKPLSERYKWNVEDIQCMNAPWTSWVHGPLSGHLSVWCRPLQDLWESHKLHLSVGLKGGLFLAEPDGRPFLHTHSPELLPWLCPDRPAHPRPSAQHPGPLHCHPSAGHPAHDCPGSVEE